MVSTQGLKIKTFSVQGRACLERELHEAEMWNGLCIHTLEGTRDKRVLILGIEALNGSRKKVLRRLAGHKMIRSVRLFNNYDLT